MMVAVTVAEDVAAAGARCVDVAVEAKVVVVVAVEVEKEAVVARGTSTGSLATTELESRLRTSEEAVARATLPPKRNPRLQENSPPKSWRQRLPGKRRRSDDFGPMESHAGQEGGSQVQRAESWRGI